ncbi:hypothetical protein HPB47_007847 [Ixodes persulcatus]|uniref:Uncharacterized protein n=1 Tax=Ixodes persulcatus TaxID=34615 RepID=A0AC60P6R6_IXOPE|nr:hypothetical protein HPB47_007847 [Ixodes persulcatus]
MLIVKNPSTRLGLMTIEYVTMSRDSRSTLCQYRPSRRANPSELRQSFCGLTLADRDDEPPAVYTAEEEAALFPVCHVLVLNKDAAAAAAATAGDIQAALELLRRERPELLTPASVLVPTTVPIPRALELPPLSQSEPVWPAGFIDTSPADTSATGPGKPTTRTPPSPSLMNVDLDSFLVTSGSEDRGEDPLCRRLMLPDACARGRLKGQPSAPSVADQILSWPAGGSGGRPRPLLQRSPTAEGLDRLDIGARRAPTSKGRHPSAWRRGTRDAGRTGSDRGVCRDEGESSGGLYSGRTGWCYGVRPAERTTHVRTKQPTRPTMDDQQSQTPTAAAVVYLPVAHRTPTTFHGETHEDVEDWLLHY